MVINHPGGKKKTGKQSCLPFHVLYRAVLTSDFVVGLFNLFRSKSSTSFLFKAPWLVFHPELE